MENMSSQRYYYRSFAYELTNYIYIQRQFLAQIIVDTIIIIFYKVTRNSVLFFNILILDFFSFLCSKMLAFLFVMVYCDISKYQDGEKIMIFFDRKTA